MLYFVYCKLRFQEYQALEGKDWRFGRKEEAPGELLMVEEEE